MIVARRVLVSLVVVAVALAASTTPSFSQPETQLAAAVAAYSSGDLASARAMITPLSQDTSPSGLRALYLLGIIDISQNRYDEAEPAFAQVAQSLPELWDYALFYEGFAAYSAGRLDAATGVFQDLLSRYPQSTVRGRTLFWCAEALRGAGSAGAADVYHAYLADFGGGRHAAAAWYGMGLSLEQVGRWADAAQSYRRVLWVFPTSASAAPARVRLRALAAAHPLPPDATPPGAVFQRATDDLAAGRAGDAGIEFRHALRLPGGWTVADGALYWLGVLAFDGRRFDEAASLFRQNVNLRQSHADDSLYYLVRIALARGSEAQALAIARTLGHDYPRSSLAPRGLYTIAATREDRGAVGPAAALFREAGDRFPGTYWGDRAGWQAGWIEYRLRAWATARLDWLKLAGAAGDDDIAAAGLYWAARAAGAAGDAADAAADSRTAAARFPATYYGQVAAAQTGVPMRVAVAAPFPDIPEGLLPPLDRFRELDALAQTTDATEALQAAVDGASPRDGPAVTLLLSEAVERQGQVRPGIRIAEQARALMPAAAGRALPLALWNALYPQGQWTPISQAVGHTGADPYLVAGVIREESRFDPVALSSAGAFGLMQLMPGTARGAARNAGVPPPDARALANPATNVLLGTVVLSELLRQYGRVDLAVAAYNAGPAAVNKWLAQRPGLDAAAFVENIPYTETRGYVKTVLESAAIYRWLYRDGHPEVTAP